MANKEQTSYEFISNKISAMREMYSSMRKQPDDYVFSALAVKSRYYKNPALVLNEDDLESMIVDGQYDGGVDFLLSDPNSEGADLIIGQSKYYRSISSEDVLNALLKMVLFYQDMKKGHFEQVNSKVQGRFLTLDSEVGEESHIRFVLFSSAPKAGIRCDRIEKKVREQLQDSANVDIDILFGENIEEDIKESESRRPTVESGKIKIDSSGNYLLYGENAAIVNVSAYSIKLLYAQHNNNLLARNLRFHIAGRDIDKGITDTIDNYPEMFWLKNNGITIICDDFDIDGKEVKLCNFSIVNGGQTTYMLHKSNKINESNDLFLPCKIIRTSGANEDEKNAFSLEIAKATNSQKAIKAIDLKANSPEQVRFGQAMREEGIFYQTKRGETVPGDFRTDYLNTDLMEVGKLCLAGIFQVPCTSRNKPSMVYTPQYYDVIFNKNQIQIAKLSKELLYVDYYYRKKFQPRFDQENKDAPDANDRLSFAHNARTICIAFVTFAARYQQGYIDNQEIGQLFSSLKNESSIDSTVYTLMHDLKAFSHIVSKEVFSEKDKFDELLYELFMLIIDAGVACFSMASNYDSTLNATNYLKKDKNYYDILKVNWKTLQTGIEEIFSRF